MWQENELNLLFLFFFGTYLLILFCKKFKLLIDNNNLPHKIFLNQYEKPPAVGGIIILTSILLISQNYILKLFLLGLFLLGLFSDLLIIKKTSYRIFIQSILILLYLIISNNVVNKVGFLMLDFFLKYNFFSIIFTFFCLLVLINGSNFIDGVNNLLSGYYLLVLSLVIFIKTRYNLLIDFELYFLLIISLFIFYIFNMFNKIFLGDSGSYLLSFIVGILLINLKNQNMDSISVFFIILLLWYPAFENLFSIVRKISIKKKIYLADNLHIHHLLFSYLKNKSKIENKVILSSLTGNIINFYNFISFSIGIYFINLNINLIFLILFNICFYIISYLYLFFRTTNLNKV
jgi:UDP-N-acetylmuramyl pentapeptide phosphotransferase/UDP-N-acetylglucosamine-1-phosphate transferase